MQAVKERIARAGADPDRVTIVAVTKGHGPEAVQAAIGAGLTEIGENYAAELLDKALALEASPDLRRPSWHFLGAVQRNKVKRLAPVVACWQSVSRPEEAAAIARHSPVPEIFLEIDLSGDPGRRGCRPGDAAELLESARGAGCHVRGLMTVAPLDDDPDRRRAASSFATVAALASRLGLGELSMGMTHDLEEAVQAGTTMVRIGTALFGERPHR